MNRTVQDLVRRPDGLTRRAQEACAHWLSECLRLGWAKAQLDALEMIWWQHHDKRGALTPNKSSTGQEARQ